MQAIIKTVKYDGTIEICKAAFYGKKVEDGHDIETNRFNIFGTMLSDIIRPKYKTVWKLIGGEGITSFKTEAQFNNWLLKNDFNGKIYTDDLIHTEVENDL